MPAIVYNCPIPDCGWTHRDDGPEPLPQPITDTDAADLAAAHSGVVAAELGAHYETHGAPEWVMLVHRLKQELGARTAPLLCVGCISDHHQAQQAGEPAPPILPAQLVVGGNSSCLGHVQFGPQQLPGRTPGGLIV